METLAARPVAAPFYRKRLLLALLGLLLVAAGFLLAATLMPRREVSWGWELAAIGVRDGEERKITDLNLPADAQVAGFSLHPDGKKFATAVGRVAG